MSANEYARQRGREALPEPSSQPAVNEKRGDLPPLSAAAQARVASNRALVREHMPELVNEIKELHELGMIDGWRDVVEVEVFPNSESGGQP